MNKFYSRDHRINQKLRKAWEIYPNPDFILTINAENQSLDNRLRHESSTNYLCWNYKSLANRRAPNQPTYRKNCQNKVEGWFWRSHKDWGICGINDGYQMHITSDPRMFDGEEGEVEWLWQLEQCAQLFKNGTKFWGFDVRHERDDNIIWVEK